MALKGWNLRLALRTRKFSDDKKEAIRLAHVGIPRSEEVREKIRQGEKGKIVSEITRRKQSKALKGHHYLRGFKRSEKNKENIARGVAEYLSTHETRLSNTSIEKIMECVIKKWIEYGIVTFYLKQHRIGKYIVDFYLPEKNLVIECYGVFWHSGFAKKYRDMKRKEYLEKLGYKVSIFWGSQIRKFRDTGGKKFVYN